MMRTAVWVLRQRRYARLALLMVVIAAGCVLAGTWQISRYEQTARTNRALKANAHAPAVAFGTVGVPLAGAGPAPGREAIRYRKVEATGTYLPGAQEFLRDRSLDGRSGFYVTDPLRTTGGVLVVVRGFVTADVDSSRPPAVAAPPPGVQHLAGRLQTADNGSDNARVLGGGEIDTVNPLEQAARLGAPVYAAYLTLTDRQAGLSALSAPDLSNPAGGAVEPQHLAYIIQWYLFALLALAAPFAVARSEVRDAQLRYLGADPDGGDFAAKPNVTVPQLASASPEPQADGAIALRGNGALAHRDAEQSRRWQRAERLASRYGRSLNTGSADKHEPVLRPVPGVGPARREPGYVAANSADRPHRSPDAYHGSYNDYLWQLAMADGGIAQLHRAATDDPPALPAPPRIIDVDGRPVAIPVEAGEAPHSATAPAGTEDRGGDEPADGQLH